MGNQLIFVASLSVNRIKAHLLIAATGKDCRFYLNGILLDAPHERVVSTDGHALLVSGIALSAKVRKINCFIIPREPLERLIKALPRVAAGVEQTIEIHIESMRGKGKRHIELRAAGQEIVTAEVDAGYPDYSRVVPKECSGDLAQFDPSSIYRMHRALNLAQGKSAAVFPIHVQHNGPLPALVSCKDPLLLGVMMPGYGERDGTQTALKRLGFIDAAAVRTRTARTLRKQGPSASNGKERPGAGGAGTAALDLKAAR